MSGTKDINSEIENLGDACMTYLIANPEELSRFMTHSGLDGNALRNSIGTKELAVGLLDYFAQNESALLAMCANAGLNADRFMRIWQQYNQSL